MEDAGGQIGVIFSIFSVLPTMGLEKGSEGKESAPQPSAGVFQPQKPYESRQIRRDDPITTLSRSPKASSPAECCTCRFSLPAVGVVVFTFRRRRRGAARPLPPRFGRYSIRVIGWLLYFFGLGGRLLG